MELIDFISRLLKKDGVVSSYLIMITLAAQLNEG